jgi:uncharacterized damage-inducible protein DinB
MTTPSSVLRDGFARHAWASLRLLDALEDLGTTVPQGRLPGTYGPILRTMTHLVDADDRYLQRMTMPVLQPFEDHGAQPVAELRPRVRAHTSRWADALDHLETGSLHVQITGRPDYPDIDRAEPLLFLQALYHGDEHRAQICSALGAAELTVPDLSVWSFWEDQRA